MRWTRRHARRAGGAELVQLRVVQLRLLHGGDRQRVRAGRGRQRDVDRGAAARQDQQGGDVPAQVAGGGRQPRAGRLSRRHVARLRAVVAAGGRRRGRRREAAHRHLVHRQVRAPARLHDADGHHLDDGPARRQPLHRRLSAAQRLLRLHAQPRQAAGVGRGAVQRRVQRAALLAVFDLGGGAERDARAPPPADGDRRAHDVRQGVHERALLGARPPPAACRHRRPQRLAHPPAAGRGARARPDRLRTRARRRRRGDEHLGGDGHHRRRLHRVSRARPRAAGGAPARR